VGIQLVTGTGQSLWIERESYPVLNDHFIERLGARLVRSDELFDAAVVSFGAFGIIAAVAIETDPVYQLIFPPVEKLGYADLGTRLNQLATLDHFDPAEPYHYEYIFTHTTRTGSRWPPRNVIEHQDGFPVPEPMWIARDEQDFALGVRTARMFLETPLLRSEWKTAIQWKEYERRAILGMSGHARTMLHGDHHVPGRVQRIGHRGLDQQCPGNDRDRERRRPAIGCALHFPGATGASLRARIAGLYRRDAQTAVFEWGVANNPDMNCWRRRSSAS
jgi:hypothetical protein